MKRIITSALAFSLLQGLSVNNAQAQNCDEYPQMLIVLDRSNSMTNRDSSTNMTKWDSAKAALSSMADAYADWIDFGVMLYPDPDGAGSQLPASADDVYACQYNGAPNTCSQSAPRCSTGRVVLDIGRNSSNTVKNKLGDPSRSNGHTPSWQSLYKANEYLQNELNHSAENQYVLFITDGWQCCDLINNDNACNDNQSGHNHRNRQLEQVQKLAANGYKTIVIGFGGSVDSTMLHRMAKAGGMPRSGCNQNTDNPSAASEYCYYQTQGSTLGDVLESLGRTITDEICGDGLDNNCNGQIDEGCGECTPGQVDNTSCGSNICGPGKRVCQSDSMWGQCEFRMPTEEVCGDRIDNDCDGITDQRTCQNTCGELGMQGCIGNSWGACNAPQVPMEVCDGIDNNCNGVVDEGCDCIDGRTRMCGSAPFCTGTETCVNGHWTGCTARQPSAEICFDGIDNDCNGRIDEGCPDDVCQPGEVAECGNGTGECKPGTRTCKEDHSWGPCQGLIGPTAEICDGKDNDCDGLTDEDLEVRYCSSGCGNSMGTQSCIDGEWSGCDGIPSSGEECNGIDDDCDGQVDEGIQPRPCNTACGAGTQRCLYGEWTQCDGPQPEDEICDGIDNNCDGLIDEGCECKDGQTQLCGSDVGECVQGTQTCQNGQWGDCIGSVGPTFEICDGLDNDCDGQVDEDASNCADGEFCSCGGCNPPCINNECANGMCTAGYCITDHCPNNYYCDNNGNCIRDDSDGIAGNGGNGGNGGYRPGVNTDAGVGGGGDSQTTGDGAAESCNCDLSGQNQGPFAAILGMLGLCGLIRSRRRK